MVHGFAAQSGGALRIESRLGSGTAVSIFLPCHAGEEAAEPAQAAEAGDVVLGDAAILLVDDDEQVRRVTAAQLRECGYRVTEAGSYSEAMQAFEVSAPFDCVVTDVVMPGGNGIALAAAIRAHRRDLPVMFITGRADSEPLAGERVLHKPFAMAELSQGVAALLDRAENERATLARIASRARSRSLKDLLAHWQEARAVGTAAPFASFDPDICTEPRNLVVMKADPACLPMRFDFVSAGEDLEALLGRPLQGSELEVRGTDGFGSIEVSYRRCVKTGLPVYDYVRTNLGDGVTTLFERLILPYSTSGNVADRLAAIVVFS
jgi:CheY-like chemotaxis protein